MKLKHFLNQIPHRWLFSFLHTALNFQKAMNAPYSLLCMGNTLDIKGGILHLKQGAWLKAGLVFRHNWEIPRGSRGHR